MLGVELNRQSEVPLKRQIYTALKDRMMSGQLKACEALPSTREMARHLEVSRNTVCEAYEMLIAEGFVVSRTGAATRVAQGICVEKRRDSVPPKRPKPMHKIEVDFQTGQPDLRNIPRFAFEQAVRKALADMPLHRFGYSGPQGLSDLRKEIASWLFRSRGLSADTEDIFITAGATHALHVVAELLYRKDASVLVEDPCHTGMLRTFINRGYKTVPVAVDEHGMQTESIEARGIGAIYVTPSHQFPLGGILPASRRAALIRYARESGSYIIEDDYDSEFRYCGEPIAPLYTMDPQQVIYVGTFSKLLYPALRIGYVILPRALHKRWRLLRTYTDVQNPPLEQAALAELLHTRKLDRHIQKMRRIYGERRRVMLQSLSTAFGSACQPWGDAAGLHLAVAFASKQFDDTFSKNCAKRGVGISSAEHHCIRKGYHTNKLIMGYGHLQSEEIEKGIRILQSAINQTG